MTAPVQSPPPPIYDLAELVATITSDNRHDEIDLGDPVGDDIL
jgi:antitoxin component of MazEF toxin-antitoxin module